MSPDERKAIRRDLVLDAGVDLLASGGPQAVTMRGVCRAARLTERYFYESFDSRDEFLLAIFEDTVLDARRVVEESLVAHTGLPPAAVIGSVVADLTRHLAADPRRGRILFVHSLSNELYPRGRELVSGFTALITGLFDAVAGAGAVTGTDPAGRHRTSLAVFGAAAFVYQDWASRGADPETREPSDDPRVVAEHLTSAVCRLLGIGPAGQETAGTSTTSSSGSGA